eukprot:scaffold4.g4983.t1
MPPPSPPSASKVTVSFRVDTDWTTGYQGTLSITNGNSYSILSWELEIAPGATLHLAFGSVQERPSNCVFTQVFAPFVDAVAWPTPQLVSGYYNATGQLFYTLAFITSQAVDGAAVPSWGGVLPALASQHMADQIRALRLLGGDVIVSFGGANGAELAQTITDLDALVVAYQSVVDLYRLHWIDFDIEAGRSVHVTDSRRVCTARATAAGGTALADVYCCASPPQGGAVADPPSVDRRNKALAQLKAANPGLTISYTLPVLPIGLTLDGENLLRNAKANGFNPDVINVMAMDYGDSAAPSPDGRMGTYALWAAGNTSRQAKEAGLTSKIGLTPMIGKNDVESEVFRLPDAEQVARFAAETPWMRWTAFWSINRDNWDGNTHVSPSASSIPQEPYAFTMTRAMEEATTGTRPARTRRANTLFTGYSDVPATTGLLRSAPPPSSSPAPARRPPFADTNGGGAACSSEQPCSEGQGASASWLPEEEGLSEGQCSPDSHAGSSPAGLGGSNLLRRGKGRKRKHRDPTFTEEERCQIAAKATAGLQQTTAKNYQSHQKKLQAFFKLQGYDISACKSWEELATLLARAMEWVGNNMPGYSYPRKKDHMSGGLLKMVRSAAIKLYDEQCLEQGWDRAPRLDEFRPFKAQYDDAYCAANPKKGRSVCLPSTAMH